MEGAVSIRHEQGRDAQRVSLGPELGEGAVMKDWNAGLIYWEAWGYWKKQQSRELLF